MIVTAERASVYSHSVASHHPLGISTGVFHGQGRGWEQQMRGCLDVSWFAAEFSALSGEELPGLISYLASEPALPFRYLSVHAPAKHMDERRMLGQLLTLPDYVRSVIVHPDALRRPGSLSRLGPKLVLENMDNRKTDGRTPQELERFFDANPEAGFCLDVAHAWSIDPTMELAHELLDSFGSQLRQLHISSLDRRSHHVELGARDELLFAPVLERCTDVPWILEAPRPARWRFSSSR